MPDLFGLDDDSDSDGDGEEGFVDETGSDISGMSEVDGSASEEDVSGSEASGSQDDIEEEHEEENGEESEGDENPDTTDSDHGADIWRQAVENLLYGSGPPRTRSAGAAAGRAEGPSSAVHESAGRAEAGEEEGDWTTASDDSESGEQS
jgi:hypothetical protein